MRRGWYASYALPVIVAWGCALPPPEEPTQPTVPGAPPIASATCGGEACEHVVLDVTRGGSADVLARWIRGDSVDEIATSLGLGPDDVRWRLIGSLRWARGRVAYDRVYAAP